MPWVSHRRISPPSRRKEHEDSRNNKWNKYYHNPTWKRLREWYIVNHPLCEDCLFEGRSVPAEEVHHKVPFSTGKTEEERIALLTSYDNVVSLCRKCHMKRHKLLNNNKE